jgi:hypothetical protein
MLGAPPVSRGAATRAPACGSRRYSRCARGNSSGRSGTGPDNRRISRGEATTCRPSVSDRDDDKLARGANREHHVLTASVHRLRASGCIPGALDLSASSLRPILRHDRRCRDFLAGCSTRPSQLDAVLSRSATAKVGYPDRDHDPVRSGDLLRSVRLNPAGSPRAAGVDPTWPAPIQADVNRQNAARSGCHQHKAQRRSRCGLARQMRMRTASPCSA